MQNEHLAIRAAMAAVTIILAGTSQVACVAGPGPMPAEAPPQPQQQPQADAPQGGGDDQGQDDAKVEDFYEPLANYGTWVDTPQYGRVWQPADDVAGEGFIPYASDGSWGTNEEGDWTYQSRYDTEYGWATYHYGRWVEHDDYGWVWLPGTVWAPAWVDWRYGGGYVGWVPLGPPGYVVNESRWFFVEERYMGGPQVYGFRVAPERLHIAYMASRPIVEVRGRGRWMAGPPADRMRASGVPIRSLRGRAPARGYARAAGVAATRSATAAGRPPRAPSAPRPRGGGRGAPPPPARNDAAPPPAHHDAAPPPAHQGGAPPPPAHHEGAPPSHHDAAPPPAHHPAPPPPPPPKRGKKR